MILGRWEMAALPSCHVGENLLLKNVCTFNKRKEHAEKLRLGFYGPTVARKDERLKLFTPPQSHHNRAAVAAASTAVSWVFWMTFVIVDLRELSFHHNKIAMMDFVKWTLGTRCNSVWAAVGPYPFCVILSFACEEQKIVGEKNLLRKLGLDNFTPFVSGIGFTETLMLLMQKCFIFFNFLNSRLLCQMLRESTKT